MKVLITGSSGFLGRHLARGLRDAGHRVVGLHLDSPAGTAGIEERRVDILDRSAVTSALVEIAPDAVIHLAGLSHVGASWERIPAYFAVNLVGVENVLDAAAGARFLLASSSEVYGQVEAEDLPLVESREAAPRNPYALTKAAAERMVLRAGGVVVRMFNVVGPGQAPSFALPNFARQLASSGRADEAGPVVLKVGNLEAERDFVDVRDAVAAYAVLVERGEGGEVYNLGSGRSVSIRSALDELVRISGLEVQVELDAARIRPVDVPRLQADNGKLRTLGWQPRYSLGDALGGLWSEVLAQERENG